jgi:hypothetical protein
VEGRGGAGRGVSAADGGAEDERGDLRPRGSCSIGECKVKGERSLVTKEL